MSSRWFFGIFQVEELISQHLRLKVEVHRCLGESVVEFFGTAKNNQSLRVHMCVFVEWYVHKLIQIQRII